MSQTKALTRSLVECSGTLERVPLPNSTLAGSALPVATQNLLAVRGRIPITPHADIDSTPAGAAPVLDGYADARASVDPIAVTVPAPVDVDIDVATLLRPACSLFTCAHVRAACFALILCRASARAVFAALARLCPTATIARLGPALGAIFAPSSRRVVTFLCLVHEPLRVGCAGPGRESRDVMSTYERERRRSGTQHQQVSHRNHPC
jgi:hypothetical protein